MQISAINSCNCPKPQFNSSLNSCNCPPKPQFTSNGYENPINRKAEKGLAIWTSIGGSVLAGLTAAGLASFTFLTKGTANRALKLTGVGAAVGLGFMALTLPSKLYNTKVNAFAREKEMDVFARDKDLKSNIMEEVNKEVKDEDVSLDEKVNHYATVQMANNGNGVMVKGA